MYTDTAAIDRALVALLARTDVLEVRNRVRDASRPFRRKLSVVRLQSPMHFAVVWPLYYCTLLTSFVLLKGW